LACAASLAARGLRVTVVERSDAPGGRCATREFVPGYFASPYADELPAIPPAIFRALELGRRGALVMPAEPQAGTLAAVREAVIDRVMADAATPQSWFFRRRPAAWPGEQLATRGGIECGGEGLGDPDRGALALLAGAPGGLVRGGLGALGAALRQAAEACGADIVLSAEATDIRRRHGRVTAVGLADGSEIAAAAVVSTLDVRRTFLSFFAWNELSKTLVERIAAFRAAPGIARLLLALDAPPAVKDPDVLRRPIPLAASYGEAVRAWSGGLIPARPPAVLRLVSAVDPFLAPDGAAVMTVTLNAIPHAPFDGPWTSEKRIGLQARALKLVEEVFPGTVTHLKGLSLLAPPDIERELGCTEGDLYGGALSPSQMLSFRPFPECAGTRTPVKGLYLAGASSALGPLATCASGVAAARAVLADMGKGA